MTHKALNTSEIKLRKPRKGDGSAVWSLIGDCKPLDENSMYCNLLQCDHFADTCILAERDGEVVGWISGYLVPNDPSTLFVWQVAVSPAARGESLGRRMLAALLSRAVCSDVTQIQTTITRDNAASWALFSRFAERSGAEMDDKTHFCRERHFDGAHDTEQMVTIRLPQKLRKAA